MQLVLKFHLISFWNVQRWFLAAIASGDVSVSVAIAVISTALGRHPTDNFFSSFQVGFMCGRLVESLYQFKKKNGLKESKAY